MANRFRHHGFWHGHHNDWNDTPPPTQTPPEESPPPETTPPPVTTSAPDFADLGATFNDATRALVGGLWQNSVEEAGQGPGSVYRYVNDLTTVQSGIQAEINAGSFSGETLGHAQDILSNIETAISAATASVNGGGSFGSVAAAETALHDSHLNVLNIVNGDANLSALATQDGANGFLAAPTTLPDGVTAATAPHDNLAEIGVIFNDLANRSLGGINSDNKAIMTDDVNALITDMQGLMANNPLLFGGLSGVHAETVVRQLQLELQYINQAGVTPDAGRASNDNILDIIDIIQGDTNLANMANQGGVAGFTAFPDSLAPTPKYLDNDAQTNFWANFIAQSNSLGQQAIQIVGNGDADATTALIAELQTFQKNVTDFDAAQGGIFEARFDNELLGSTSTLGAEVAKMIEGLQSGNAALVAAAAEEMHANAADVGGNNLPNTGGTYNPDGLTFAEVLPQASSAAVAAAAPVAAAATQVAAATAPVVATPASTAAASAAPDATIAPAASDVAVATTPTNAVGAHAAPHIEHFHHHFEHFWG
jgi:hypothetical protein